ncbi:UDP-N-acetylenolpyruvoylglucosamine reductase [gamma proteobacterium NOR5-3]|nr:UDP-N-acetylenolpyruvoylglucosamine reductase [gamma proteobacterium NOR5-3]
MSDLSAPDVVNAVANTLALPCMARRLTSVCGSQDVLEAMEWAQKAGLPLMPLGEGSNVVLPRVLEAVVLKVADSSLSILADAEDSVTLRVGAGKVWHALVSEAVHSGYYGLENLALIPGLVGAAPVQNIGAYGKELGDYVVAIHGFDLITGAAQTLDSKECGFSYRSSVFKQELQDRFLITAVDLKLSRAPVVNIDYPVLKSRIGCGEVSPTTVFEAVVALRQERLPNPAHSPNAGSFFKNPILSTQLLRQLQSAEPEIPVYPVSDELSKVSAAWLIERAGLRGYAQGNVAMSDQHALVLVTDGHAVQGQVLELARYVQTVVLERFGVALEPEPRFYD